MDSGILFCALEVLGVAGGEGEGGGSSLVDAGVEMELLVLGGVLYVQ